MKAIVKKVVCSCLNDEFKAEYNENHCEAGECIRFFCTKCNEEQDWHAKGNRKHFDDNGELKEE